jgi:hypothetical protein
MDDTKRQLERAQHLAPTPAFDLDDVRDRRSRHDRRRRVSATIVGLGITAAIVAGAVFATASNGTHGGPGPAGGGALPAPVRTVALAPGEFSYLRIKIESTSTCANCGVNHVELLAESWWALDGSGRIDVSKAENYGIHGSIFGPGTFPAEGDLTAFPTDPEALRTFLLERSADDGASPRPEVTPAPGVSLDDGLLWLAIQDYLGSTQYLNATPELRAAMLQVLAQSPMVRVSTGATDPLGRPASALTFHAYEREVTVFVEPTSGDFMAKTERFDDGSSGSVIVEEAGIATSDQAQPQGHRITVPAGADGAALTGDALAESLGLAKLPEKPGDCVNYVEVDDPAGYCIEEVVHNFQESWTLGRLLRGMPIDDVERQIAALTEELSRTESGSERYHELLVQIEALNQQRADDGEK